ncbi:MAG TPA: T9SS type A sorting domain-containing protein [Caldithrix abyssi]|uniref:T9SS type A sorting domain-containing protein n=1 Tax=Caldithrix abyssi TaxID=187145 RepID=A0A7V4U2P1_CALAY|nr:T9SS type A sorting domain-containing protein [Caldithrix abyssi]
MKNTLLLVCIFFLPILLFAQDSTYTNPVGNFIPDGDTADPYVLRYNGKYYLYATSAQTHTYGYKVWESDDLVNWVPRGDCFRNDWDGNSWGTANFWAPEVVYYQGQFYMVYSARTAEGKLQIALAKSSSPLGPFINDAAPLLGDELEAIDGHFFFDDDGSIYLYYSIEVNYNIVNGHHTAEIYAQKMSHYMRPTGDPVLVATPEQEWELKTGDWRWNEGPTVFKDKGTYYLMYSANVFNSPDYGIGYATASSPTGPFTKYSGNPILSSNLDIGVSGPGHNSVTWSPDGTERFIVYHAHINPDDPNGGRTIYIDRMRITYTGLVIDGPTRTPQPMPSDKQTSIDTRRGGILRDFKINSVYPNPFNGMVVIDYQASVTEQAMLAIYDSSGRQVRVLYNGRVPNGRTRTRWFGKNNRGHYVASGVYICALFARGRLTDTKKILFIK